MNGDDFEKSVLTNLASINTTLSQIVESHNRLRTQVEHLPCREHEAYIAESKVELRDVKDGFKNYTNGQRIQRSETITKRGIYAAIASACFAGLATIIMLILNLAKLVK